MPIILLNNYPENNLESSITKKDGSPLNGEIWLYQQFINFNKYNLLPEGEVWHLKHDYNLSSHPLSEKKVEGQIDFVVISKYGVLVIEIKGGGLRVDVNDNYFSYNRNGEYKTQNPFNQAKEYTHSLHSLIDSKPFVYRAVILPHEAGFKLVGNQLNSYKNLFFSKNDFKHLEDTLEEKAISKLFFNFIVDLAKSSRRKIIRELNPNWSAEKINSRIFEKFPELTSKKIRQLKSEMFPDTESHGYNPERINRELILNENYEILKGLRRNEKVLVQGSPGTGKTVLAKKFIAENLLKQHNGIVFNANKLIKSKLEHILLRDYELDSEKILFDTFSRHTDINAIDENIDFLVFDEAHEYFNKGLFDFIELASKKLQKPKILILYDPNQSIISDIEDLSFYTDYFIDEGFAHFYFDEQHRCAQNKNIAKIADDILHNKVDNLAHETAKDKTGKNDALFNIIDDEKFTSSEKIILVNNLIIDDFKDHIKITFKKQFEELTDKNINNPSNKIRFTTPLKYRGLENKAVYLITNNLSEANKVKNYVAVTRAMEQVKIILWSK